jgi:hypothetical protein
MKVSVWVVDLRILYRSLSCGKLHRIVEDFCCCFALISCLAYVCPLKMEAVCSLETLLNLYRTTRRHIQKDSALDSFII